MTLLDRWPWRAAIVAAGTLALASMFGPWRTQGAASALSGHKLADLLLAGSLSVLVPRWVGGALYLVPMAGAVAIIGAGLGGRAGRLIVVGATAGLGLLDLLVSAALEWKPVSAPGRGALALHTAVLLACAALVTDLLARRVRRSGRAARPSSSSNALLEPDRTDGS